jgi:hypothetical protein
MALRKRYCFLDNQYFIKNCIKKHFILRSLSRFFFGSPFLNGQMYRGELDGLEYIDRNALFHGRMVVFQG